MLEDIRYEMIFSGQVQGVGFRYTAFRLANSLGLTGWVKNEWDGSVRMQIQGDMAKIAMLLKRLNNEPFIQIDDIQKKMIPLNETESSFTIR